MPTPVNSDILAGLPPRAGSVPGGGAGATRDEAGSVLAGLPRAAGSVGNHSTPDTGRFDQTGTIERVGGTTPQPETFRPQDHRPILLYNKDCETCQTIANWIIAQDKVENGGQQMIDERPIPWDDAELKKLHPDLTMDVVHTRSHMIMPDGTLRTGGEAVLEVFKRIPELKLFGWFFGMGIGNFRPLLPLLEASYKFLDAIRPALGCTSCGGGAVKWWAKPIEWVANGIKALVGSGGGD